MSCSIQQAYEILIDDSACTLEEYRVYSQLTRYGYRIQRYFYEESDKCNRSDEPILIKRKIIVDPENGLRMSDNQPQNQQNARKSKLTLVKDMPETSDKLFVNLNTKDQKITVQESVKQTVCNLVDEILYTIESHESHENVNKPATSRVVENNMTQSDINDEEKNRNSKPEIISDETLLGNIKILRDTPCKVSKWPGARIQRNVKQLPKRNDKVSPPEISIIDSGFTSENPRCTEKRKVFEQINKLHAKKPKLEVRSNVHNILYLPKIIFFFFI